MSVFDNAELWRRFVRSGDYGATRLLSIGEGESYLSVRSYINNLQKRLIHCTFTIKGKMSFTCAFHNKPHLPAKFYSSKVVLHGGTTEEDCEHYLMIATLVGDEL